ncbi:MAG: hypothetical protein OXB86_06910 [Bdellovibrionales bacterium]|nr:hypothetical protein [Bdellovibrionales bacterium]
MKFAVLFMTFKAKGRSKVQTGIATERLSVAFVSNPNSLLKRLFYEQDNFLQVIFKELTVKFSKFNNL